MLILAIDTTGEQGGIGIFRNERPLAVAPNPGPANTYSVTLFQMLERVLSTARLSLEEVDLFAVTNGPGSFTGIRVGVAAAQGLATAFGRPVRAVSTLEAMAEEAQPEDSWAVPILDARGGEFYLALYRQAPEGSRRRLVSEGEGMVVRKEALPRFLSDIVNRHSSETPVQCLVREHDQAALALRPAPDGAGLRGHAGDGLSWRIVPGVLLGAIARLAFHAAEVGDLQSPAEVDACYIRRSDAELKLGAKGGEGRM